MLALQGPVLGKVAEQVGGPIQAAIVAFVTGVLALLAVSIAFGEGMPTIAGLRSMPAWAWSGGLFGTIMIVLTLFAVPRIGVATFVAAAVSGQLIAGLGVDYFWVVTPEISSIGGRQVFGAFILVVGTALIADR